MDFLSTTIAISTALVIFAIVRTRLCTEKKKRYHPVVTTCVHTLINFNRLHDYIAEFGHKNKTFRALNLIVNYVFTVDPANVEYILKTNFANYGRGLYSYNILADVVGDGIFGVDGEKWLHQRKLSSYELSTKVVKDYSNEVFKTDGVKLAGIVSEAARCGQAIEIQDLFMKAGLDSIVKILLGIELDTLYGTNEEGTRFSHAFDEANELTLYRYVDFSWKIKRFLNIGSEAVLKNNIKVIDQFLYKLINRKIEIAHNSSEDELPAASRRGDIISRLLAVRETDPKYLRDLIFSLFVAGKDSTASNLSWFVYLLCKHPHIQEKVAREVREATNLKDDSSIDGLADSLSEEALNKMQYLFAALTETLRLYPSVPLNAKICSSDDTWQDGFSVKKGDMVGYHAYSMGRMKYLWGDDAEEFRPERWLNEDGIFQHESPFKFTAFSAGPRICVGKDIAHRETMIFSAVLLGSFIFNLSDENKVAHYTTKFTLHIDGGLYVHASPRFAHP
ncbi:cytochrome P450 704C1-like isoform X1 [Pyrus x bretschneideri]|uniref:cytochrome P450 704C1-like isoform X1 n=1 Tax=Pyrus x bretschneideri TaxID=225117 RepID=UPI0005119B49|nr:cytochrome P450 704C1-like isoform X1 [Pyrus x bretschneideri]